MYMLGMHTCAPHRQCSYRYVCVRSYVHAICTVCNHVCNICMYVCHMYVPCRRKPGKVIRVEHVTIAVLSNRDSQAGIIP